MVERVPKEKSGDKSILKSILVKGTKVMRRPNNNKAPLLISIMCKYVLSYFMYLYFIKSFQTLFSYTDPVYHKLKQYLILCIAFSNHTLISWNFCMYLNSGELHNLYLCGLSISHHKLFIITPFQGF